MNKNDLIAAVAEKTGLTKAQAGEAVDATLDAITGTLKGGGEVRIIGLRQLLGFRARCLRGPQPAYRRHDPDSGVQDAEVQGRQGPEGRGEQLIGVPLLNFANGPVGPPAGPVSVRRGHVKVVQGRAETPCQAMAVRLESGSS